jgi:hypothetical protein
MSHLLIVDDDPNTLASLARAFRLRVTRRPSRIARRVRWNWCGRKPST